MYKLATAHNQTRTDTHKHTCVHTCAHSHSSSRRHCCTPFKSTTARPGLKLTCNCTQLNTHRHTHMSTLTFLNSEAPLYGLHQLHPALQSSANILQGLTRHLRPNKWPCIFSRSCVCIERVQCACMRMCVCARVS